MLSFLWPYAKTDTIYATIYGFTAVIPIKIVKTLNILPFKALQTYTTINSYYSRKFTTFMTVELWLLRP